MSASPRGMALLVWCLAAFHSAGLVVLLVTLLHLSGSLGDTLDGLNTAVGLGLYGALWASNWWVTGRATNGLDLIDPDRPVSGVALLGRGVVWGGVNGMLFVVVLVGLLFVQVVADGDVSALGALALLIYFIVLGCVLAFIAGAVVGLAFAIVDWTLLEIAHALWRAGGRASEMGGPANDAAVDMHRPPS